ncbi:MAG: N-6 DNA methylase [Acidimicrobiales bacterium]|nr:N-6 DNA methylase [Acidimicrobiales bacterium]MYB81755.1 N-6 DNA methylase [Acidimicrobiales bacterium]MYI13683.1 N-6 DNA methylase [Acidimicrobiales bacterium]
MARKQQSQSPSTPQARLRSVIDSARKTMRKDAGLNGDLDRIPQLAWLLFLRAFDGLEMEREIIEDDYRPAIEAPFRWRDWAADRINGLTGDDLLGFVEDELFPYLRELRGDTDRDPRDVVATVFKETYNRMVSGYLLSDVIEQVNKVDFTLSEDVHTMALLYESMLREMRDAAGDSGEFYTPRPVIRFIVQMVDPHLGEIVLDPACGTGGFLVETLEHLIPQISTVAERQELAEDLRGVEKKPLPFLLGTMNLLLHGLARPNLIRGNALARPLTEIKRAERVDVILTNPPFGGEEEKSILTNFPAGTQTAETAWLFMQLVQRLLADGGRCGIVVPNGVLFADGPGARIKEELLKGCNLHTIVRLGAGVFAPYTDIPSNILFFEKTGSTKEVWFYEISPPTDRKKYSKTRPMRFAEFDACAEWWGGPERLRRVETEWAWRVDASMIADSGWNLDLKNPNPPEKLAHRPPMELITDLLEAEQEILTLLGELETEFGSVE